MTIAPVRANAILHSITGSQDHEQQ